jgi:hypothetical protein
VAEAPLLTSRQMAEFVADGCLRFDAVVPRPLCDEALAELAAGGPAKTKLADSPATRT